MLETAGVSSAAIKCTVQEDYKIPACFSKYGCMSPSTSGEKNKNLIMYLKFSKAYLELCLERLHHVHHSESSSISDSSPLQSAPTNALVYSPLETVGKTSHRYTDQPRQQRSTCKEQPELFSQPCFQSSEAR